MNSFRMKIYLDLLQMLDLIQMIQHIIMNKMVNHDSKMLEIQINILFTIVILR